MLTADGGLGADQAELSVELLDQVAAEVELLDQVAAEVELLDQEFTCHTFVDLLKCDKVLWRHS